MPLLACANAYARLAPSSSVAEYAGSLLLNSMEPAASAAATWPPRSAPAVTCASRHTPQRAVRRCRASPEPPLPFSRPGRGFLLHAWGRYHF